MVDVPEILYHGGTVGLVERAYANDRYFVNDGNPVCLSENPTDAIDFAALNSEYLNVDPAILVVKTCMVDRQLMLGRHAHSGTIADGWFEIESLCIDSFLRYVPGKHVEDHAEQLKMMGEFYLDGSPTLMKLLYQNK